MNWFCLAVRHSTGRVISMKGCQACHSLILKNGNGVSVADAESSHGLRLRPNELGRRHRYLSLFTLIMLYCVIRHLAMERVGCSIVV